MFIKGSRKLFKYLNPEFNTYEYLNPEYVTYKYCNPEFITNKYLNEEFIANKYLNLMLITCLARTKYSSVIKSLQAMIVALVT